MDRIESFPVACAGGLVTNLPQLAQASQFPGTARELENFEPSVEGGYRRINGYTKYAERPIPVLRRAYTQQAYSIGATSIAVGNFDKSTYLTLGGISLTFSFINHSTVYTVTGYVDSGVGVTTTGTLSFTPALTSSIQSRASVNFINAAFSTTVDGSLVAVSSQTALGPQVYAFKSTDMYIIQFSSFHPNFWYSNGTHLSFNNYYARVDGAGQTGTTLNLKNLKYIPRLGDTFWIGTSSTPIPELYTVTSGSSSSGLLPSGTHTITIYPALSSSPNDNAFIVWLSSSLQNINTSSFVKYRKDGLDSLAIAGTAPMYAKLIGSIRTYEFFEDLYVKLDGEKAIAVSFYKKHLFWATDGNKLLFSTPFDEFDYSPDKGAGIFSFREQLVGLKALRDSLIIFCREGIYRLRGSSSEDFALELITSNTGCVDGNSIQEINGDVLFLSYTGLSRLSDTDQQSGLGISNISNTIKTETSNFIEPFLLGIVQRYPSVYFNDKGQYRIFSYNEATSKSNTVGICFSQITTNINDISWSVLKGIKVLSIDTNPETKLTVFFADQTDGYIYQMDSGNTFDGTAITATYSTPYYTFNDPKMRKNFLKLTMTVEPEGNVTTTVDTLLNYNKSDVIQPPSVVLGTTSSTYGDTTSPSYETLLIGNGESMSLKFVSNTNIPPYVIQSFTIEYSTNDRR